MKKSLFIIMTVVALIIILVGTAINTPVILGSSGALLEFSVDDLIKRAELIIIGEVNTNLPSRWMGPNRNDPSDASPDEVVRARGLFTDSLISVNQVLKGDFAASVVRVRAFTGQTSSVVWSNDDEPSYIPGETYLLFLKKDHGPTAPVDPGDYIAAGAIQGVYEISGNKAISINDEWVLEELIAYIQNSLSQTP